MKLSDATKACSQNSLFYRGMKLFNKLPMDIRDENDYKKYDQKLKNYINNNLETVIYM